MPRPLPPDFDWYAPTWNADTRLLRIGGEWGLEVAMVSPRVDGRWLSQVNRHAEWPRRAHAISRTRETGMRWAGYWAAARAERLRAAAVEQAKPRQVVGIVRRD